MFFLSPFLEKGTKIVRNDFPVYERGRQHSLECRFFLKGNDSKNISRYNFPKGILEKVLSITFTKDDFIQRIERWKQLQWVVHYQKILEVKKSVGLVFWYWREQIKIA